jgi:hypothetical protein
MPLRWKIAAVILVTLTLAAVIGLGLDQLGR